MKVINAIVCEGTYEGKPYRNGRLVVAKYDDGKIAPAWITVAKTTAEIASDLCKKVPCDVTLFYDAYKNVVGYSPK